MSDPKDFESTRALLRRPEKFLLVHRVQLLGVLAEMDAAREEVDSLQASLTDANAYAVSLCEEASRLVILRSCGDCGWSRPEASERWRCGHRDAKPENIILDAPPGAACPLREKVQP